MPLCACGHRLQPTSARRRVFLCRCLLDGETYAAGSENEDIFDTPAKKQITDLDDTLMTDQDSLLETVASLIIRRCEGTYWDFKRRHHTNRQNLIHDILCLANAKHR